MVITARGSWFFLAYFNFLFCEAAVAIAMQIAMNITFKTENNIFFLLLTFEKKKIRFKNY